MGEQPTVLGLSKTGDPNKRVLVPYICAGCKGEKQVDRSQVGLRVKPLMCAPCGRKRSRYNNTPQAL